MTHWELQNIYIACVANVSIGLVILLEVKVIKWLFDGENGKWLISLFRGKRR